jgi:hypothetical protein
MSENEVACGSGQEEKIMSIFLCFKNEVDRSILLDLDLARLRSLDELLVRAHDLGQDSVALMNTCFDQGSEVLIWQD